MDRQLPSTTSRDLAGQLCALRSAMSLILLVGSSLIAGCAATHDNPPRPTVEQLMQRAIEDSAEYRPHQKAIAAGAETPLHLPPGEGSYDGSYDPAMGPPMPTPPPVGSSQEPLLLEPSLNGPAMPQHHSIDMTDPPMPREFADSPTATGTGVRTVAHDAETLPPPPNPFLPGPIAKGPQSIPLSMPVVKNNQAKISESFLEVDVREALAILAAEAGADLLIDDLVRGVVNVTIQDATFEEALEKVLLPLGYVIGRRGQQYIVCPPDPSSSLFAYVSTQVEYRPRYLSAKALMSAPPQQMAGYVRTVEESNTLVIEAPTQYIGTILDRIRSLDQPVPQVELEAIICIVSPDSGFRFGLDWEHALELNGETAFNLGVSGLAISGKSTGRGISNVFEDFATTSAFVKLLAENGYLTIRASPRVMAEDGEKADITIGRETFFAIQPPGANGDNSAFFFQPDIQKVESGISLKLTPYIRNDAVTIAIEKAEVSEDIRSSGTENALNPYPIINRRSVSTTVNVRDGKTIIIGGLVQRETIDRINRVPGLSRLPGVGYLFKSVERQSREAEVVIFISPRIVKPEGCEQVCNEVFDPRH